jgi:oxygen-independent coproporphyrinogen-3 oxidase
VLKVPHISCYALKLEEGTKLAAEFSGADEDIDREMYHRSARLLRKTGYLHYETSNFALPGYECRHNLKYWTGGEYLGLGIAAHSYLADATKTRHANTQRLEDYILRVEEGMKPVSQLDELTPEDELTEYLMLRLRLAKGIDETDYTQRFHEEFFCRFADSIQIVKNAGLISVDAMGIRPTLKGFDLQNTLIGEFIKKI